MSSQKHDATSDSVQMTPIKGRSRPNSIRGRSSTGSRRNSLTRIYSAAAFDDHAVYHQHHDDEEFAGEAHDEKQEVTPESSEDHTRVNSREAEKEGEDEGHESYEEEEEEPDVVPEVRQGILVHRDVEQGPKIEKSKSRASSKGRDPNLVTWDGPDDPENPKVCLPS